MAYVKLWGPSHKTGFTLIELLVVIGIIGILSSIVLVSVNDARKKARDAKAISDFREIRTALALYYAKYNKYPNESTPLPSSDPRYRWNENFNSMAKELVDKGFLSSVPIAPANHGYQYYYYNNKNIGALLVTNLETIPNTTTGISPSCRPFTGNNWCSNEKRSNHYCICNPY